MDEFETIRLMSEKERLALRRCATYLANRQDDLEELGSSDISCFAAEMLRRGDWPTEEERGDVTIGFLVEEYSKDVYEHDCGPKDTLVKILESGAQHNALPEFLYESKHMLGMGAIKDFNRTAANFLSFK